MFDLCCAHKTNLSLRIIITIKHVKEQFLHISLQCKRLKHLFKNKAALWSISWWHPHVRPSCICVFQGWRRAGWVGQKSKTPLPTWRHSYALTYLAIPLIHCHSLQFLHHPFTMYRGQTCKKLRMSSNLKQNILKVKKSHLLLINDEQSYANTVKVKI